ncbi:M-phase inducer phosphatase [Contarinia nasturtii]|uniref:M-phase inducer phosphatase n=1 Tax=Contarinia nasturtii TaxID=265458 RepID=UPI0012D440E3|nr:M-phase inducer phosphatase [Contarinia nasturtii]XP_031616978.1 M-phase inducer phosphatase [Contarinia nasturtii]XP_031616979.1 M-phase inducer phosphatase [Contarinia nasturtii]XP_031616980.1 M-phase inducer phosphatase [Contarinia nasturtii]
MRLYESLSYLNNNNNNNNHANDNNNIDRGCHSNGNTVKTFTSNGKHQSNNDSVIGTAPKTATTTTAYFECSDSIGSDVLNSTRNWQLETEFSKALAALNETYCFYGSQRKLKSRENLATTDNDDDNANGNDVNHNESLDLTKDTVDLIDDSSSDIEAEVNRLINRSNLCRQNFESHQINAPNTEEQLMDEEEEFSSLSISASLSAEKSPYPRGIINPNYPGFQHLAHTLSEHFVDHHANQIGSMSDSDFSEVDSDFPSEGHSTENNNTFACGDDSNGNNIVEESVTPTSKNDNLSTVEEILRTVFESNSCHLSTAIEMFTEKELANEQTDIDAMDYCITDIDACDLKTYLEHYDDGGINITNIETFAKKIDSPTTNEPDVIKKSNSCEKGFEQQSVDKPDILLDVTEPVPSNGEKEEPSAWSITPVDIVGNFEQEVERELGLLVTGYRSNSFSQDDGDVVDASISSKETNDKFMDKITDAVLSNAHDMLSKASVSASKDGKQLIKEDSMAKNQIPTAIVKPKYQRSSFDDRQLPTVAYMNEDKVAWYDKQSNNAQTEPMIKCSASVTVATHPKKIHLPEFDRKAKKHMTSAKSAHNSAVDENTIAAHKTNEAVTSAAATIDNTKCSSDGKESVSCADTNRKVVHKSKKASVAIVQPRKKERMDERTLMETIVQMQIKKNALLYRGQGNKFNNNNNNKPTANTTSSPTNPTNGNVKHFNNNNNGENCTNSELNQAKKDQKEHSGCFDVYNIETALPVIDLETIANHLKLVKEDDRRKRNDREEIRRRLAMGAEDDYLTKIQTTKPARKPSLQTRLQEGKNLQICFVNDAAAADGDSLSSDSESCPNLSKAATHNSQSSSRHSNTNTVQPNPYNSRPLSMKKTTSQEKVRSSALTLDALKTDDDPKEIDFFTKQARLQIEARMALAQAKDIAHMQMEMERQKQMESPITNMIRGTIEKVGYNFPVGKRRVSRQMLTDMNLTQLQIIVNEFHTQIESLNEQLVKYLMDRDDLHMSQDSMLVDIEDLTRYLGAKKDPFAERKTTKKYHSMKSPKYMVSKKIQPQPRLASQIGKS